MSYYVISADGCKWCEKAVDLLEERGLPYSLRKVEGHTLGLMKLAGLRTVPQIFDENKDHIGGYEDLEKHLS